MKHHGNLIDDRVHEIALGANQPTVDHMLDALAGRVRDPAAGDRRVEPAHHGRVRRAEHRVTFRTTKDRQQTGVHHRNNLMRCTGRRHPTAVAPKALRWSAAPAPASPICRDFSSGARQGGSAKKPAPFPTISASNPPDGPSDADDGCPARPILSNGYGYLSEALHEVAASAAGTGPGILEEPSDEEAVSVWPRLAGCVVAVWRRDGPNYDHHGDRTGRRDLSGDTPSGPAVGAHHRVPNPATKGLSSASDHPVSDVHPELRHAGDRVSMGAAAAWLVEPVRSAVLDTRAAARHALGNAAGHRPDSSDAHRLGGRNPHSAGAGHDLPHGSGRTHESCGDKRAAGFESGRLRSR